MYEVDANSPNHFPWPDIGPLQALLRTSGSPNFILKTQTRCVTRYLRTKVFIRVTEKYNCQILCKKRQIAFTPSLHLKLSGGFS